MCHPEPIRLAQDRLREGSRLPGKEIPFRVTRGRRATGQFCMFCGSARRAAVAANLLKRAGWDNLTVVLGGLARWTSVSCPSP
jgi:rhodanese-related sulfurtransferase